MATLDKKGFSTLETVLMVIIIVLVGFVGWYVYKQRQNNSGSDIQPTETQSQTVPEIKEPGDLDDAQKLLDDADIEKELDTTEIDSVLDV